MELTHTPGPWNQARKANGEMVWFQRYDGDPELHGGTSNEEHKANMRLLDASPDLLAALIVLRERHQIDDPHHADLCEFCQQADAAIAKATGDAA